METGIWPAEQKIEYATMMLYHNVKNSDEERVIKQIVKEQEKNKYINTFHQRVKRIAEDLDIDIDKATTTRKSAWKKEVKERIMIKIKNRLADEMNQKTKCRTVSKDKWGRKEYIKECNGESCYQMYINVL